MFGQPFTLASGSNVNMSEAPAPNGAAEVSSKDAQVLDMGDGDFGLWVNDTLFKTHAYLLKRFSSLKYRVEAAIENEDQKDKPIRGIIIQRDERGLTTSGTCSRVVDGPFNFDPPTLISALRIATAYDHPNLRSFAIKHLESVPLNAIERIRLSREFGLTSWAGPAYIELCERDEAITKEEANVLGIDVFVHVAKIREVEQRRRGRVVDGGEPVEGDGLSTAGTDVELSGGGNKPASPTQKKHKKKSAKRSRSPDNPLSVGVPNAVPGGPKPWFADIPTPGLVRATEPRYDAKVMQYFEVPGCRCRYNSDNCPCRIPPCVYEVVKALEARQAAHTTNMDSLKEAIQEIEDRNVPVPETVSPPAPVVTHVGEQVLKWLSGVRT
ncbi:hypothetical protein BDV93DRAFT_555817 [Ceratobasidium sp. AG-I]|nr:hypothetical protein BDV93DRAFT_555817 [Ceratobasidium sp. AG-I]